MNLAAHIDALDWPAIHHALHTRGYARVPGFLSDNGCASLRGLYGQDALYRKTVVMARHRFGLGEYRYFKDPLPPLVGALRQRLYPHLAPVANDWARQLKLDKHYPPTLTELAAQCRAAGQSLPTPLILRYGEGGYNTLHQDLYGEVYFPLQALFVLSQHGADYDGGEFVLTEQVPRAQSRPTVLRPDRGDMLIFTTHFRPAPGKLGHYRVHMKHGVAEVTRGERLALGVIFHDAAS
ncbi:MAG: 2OG-Fe(II) oxygenase [Pseudomonadota bacterium]|nr:2OG-Fe(II) oxygenase [Pseudomonadota bacterium]